MDPDRWLQIKELYSAAAQLRPGERERMVALVCGEENELCREVKSLLAYEERAAEFMEAPAMETFSRIDCDTSTSDSVPPGSMVSHYRILERIGSGGMGIVYKAEDTRLRRYIALKFLPNSLRNDSSALTRFQREAQSASALNHPNICTVYDIDTRGDHPFVAMEFLEGVNLAEALAGKPMEADLLVSTAVQIAEGLGAAHQKGIIHRDVKPANIFITQSKQVKILDFGIAKSARLQATNEGSGTLTATGAALGTLGYMSPEQAMGKELDARADLFSFGVVLYEMATGEAPFRGETSAAIFDAVLHKKPVPPRAVNPTIPSALERVIGKCLEKQLARRYQQTSDVVSDLRSIPEASRYRISNYWKSTLIGTAALLLFTTLIMWLRSYGPPLKIITSSQVTNDGRNKIGAGVLHADTRLVTDGARLYFSEFEHGYDGVGTEVAISGGDTTRFNTPLSLINILDISADKSKLLATGYTVDENRDRSNERPVWTIPTVAGGVRRLGQVRAHDAAWSPNGQHIVFARDSDLYIATAEGLEPTKIVAIPRSGWPVWPRFSPDGTRLRFTVYDGGGLSIWEVAVNGTGLHRVILPNDTGSQQCCGAWTDDGKLFLYQSEHNGVWNIWALPEASQSWLHGAEHSIQLTSGPLSYYSPLPSKDGKTIFVIGRQSRSELVHYDADTKQFRPFLSGISAGQLEVSRDRRRITYVAYPEETLWCSNSDGSNRIQLTYPPMRVATPHWSPDGRNIAFMAAEPNRPWQIFLISAEGGPFQRLTTGAHSGEGEGDPSWSADGYSLLYGDEFVVGRPSLIHTLDLRTRRITDFPGSEGLFGPRWSPDGRYIAALRNDDTSRLVLFDVRRQRWTALPVKAGFLTWSADSKYLYFDTPDFTNGGVSISRLDPISGVVSSIVDLHNLRPEIWDFIGFWSGFAPDGSIITQRDVSTEEVYALQLQGP